LQEGYDDGTFEEVRMIDEAARLPRVFVEFCKCDSVDAVPNVSRVDTAELIVEPTGQ
jgi:hypothetical protein